MKKSIISILLVFFIFLPQHAVSARDIVILGLFKNKVIFKLDNKQYTLSPGDSIDDDIILVSANSKEAIFEISGVQQAYTLGGHIGSNFTQSRPAKTVTIAPDRDGMYWVNGSINKHQSKFIVDTGATMISMNKHEAARFGIDYKLTGKRAMSNTASGPDTIYIVRLNSVNIGGIQINNVAAAVHDSDYPNVILLGNSFLNSVSIKREGLLLQLSR